VPEARLQTWLPILHTHIDVARVWTECRCGKQKSRFSTNIWLHRVLFTVLALSVIYTAALDRGELVTLIANSNKRRRLLFAGDGRQSVYGKKLQRYAEGNITQFNCTHR